jgi:hypothetical protein
LQLLLQPHSGGVIEQSPVKSDALPQYEVEVSKHLIHYGIAAVLYKQAKTERLMSEFANDEHIGRRVAKLFDVEADDGDNIYRGTVVGVNERDGAKEYGIKYDDGDTEDVSVVTLFGE